VRQIYHLWGVRSLYIAELTSLKAKRCMLASTKPGSDFSKGRAHPAMQPPISATHPNTKTGAPLPGPGPKRITCRSTVGGALVWGRGKPSPAHCPSTAHKPPTHHTARHTHAPQSIASRGAPRRNLLFWQPPSHAISSSMSWSRRSSKLWMSASLPFLHAHSR
jgi:hypothetical protein